MKRNSNVHCGANQVIPYSFSVKFDPKKTHSPQDSFDSIIIPLHLAHNQNGESCCGNEQSCMQRSRVRIRYVNHTGTTRFGRILEDLDAFASIALIYLFFLCSLAALIQAQSRPNRTNGHTDSPANDCSYGMC